MPSLMCRAVGSLYVQLPSDKKLTAGKVDSIPCGHVACNMRLLDQLEEKSPSPRGINVTSFVIHLLYQTEISSPSPIINLLPALRINLELIMLRHTKVSLCLKVDSKKLHLEQYLAL